MRLISAINIFLFFGGGRPGARLIDSARSALLKKNKLLIAAASERNIDDGSACVRPAGQQLWTISGRINKSAALG